MMRYGLLSSVSKKSVFFTGLCAAVFALSAVTVLGKHKSFATGWYGPYPTYSEAMQCQGYGAVPGQAAYDYNYAPGAYTASATGYPYAYNGQYTQAPYYQACNGQQPASESYTPPSVTVAQPAPVSTPAVAQPIVPVASASASEPSPFSMCGTLTASPGSNAAGQAVTNFSASPQANGATFTGATIFYGDNSSDSLSPGSNGASTASHAYPASGTYLVNVIYSYTEPNGSFQQSVPCPSYVNAS